MQWDQPLEIWRSILCWFTSCKVEIVFVLICRVISGSQLLQKNWSSNFGLIEEIMDLHISYSFSCTKILRDSSRFWLELGIEEIRLSYLKLKRNNLLESKRLGIRILWYGFEGVKWNLHNFKRNALWNRFLYKISKYIQINFRQNGGTFSILCIMSRNCFWIIILIKVQMFWEGQFWKKCPDLIWHSFVKSKKLEDFFQNFVAFSEYLNFTAFSRATIFSMKIGKNTKKTQ